MKYLILVTCALFLSIFTIQAQESQDLKENKSKQEKLRIELKDGVKPEVYVDGVKFNFPIDLLDVDKIESVNVLKDDRAIKEYNAKNGVVLITTKKNAIPSESSETMIKDVEAPQTTPVIIINGKKTEQKSLKKLDPDDIESIKVLKDEAALKKYNTTIGVILVTTKKGNKK